MGKGRSHKNKSSHLDKSKGSFLPQFLVRFLKFLFAKKTVLFVTNNKIRSINIGSAVQVTVALFLLWVGNLFWQSLQYDKILTTKSEEINRLRTVNGFFGNEVDHMNEKLKKIREYLVYLTGENQRTNPETKEIKQPDNFNKENLSQIEKEILNDIQKADNQIASIQSVAKGRIKRIESVISVTGLNIKKIPTKLKEPKTNIASKHFSLKPMQSNTKGQGGPLVDDASMESEISQSNLGYDLAKELEETNFTSEIEYLMVLENLIDVLPFGKPMKNYYISSSFGTRIDPITGRKARHRGLDFVGVKKEKIFSPSDGKVILAGRYSEYGNAIVIDHGFGITTRYGHLSEIKVKKGQIVKPGDLIALQGNSGRSTGPHLHYEVRYKKAALDPSKFLEAGKFLSASTELGKLEHVAMINYN